MGIGMMESVMDVYGCEIKELWMGIGMMESVMDVYGCKPWSMDVNHGVWMKTKELWIGI
jgi:hypothetical protein